MRAEELSDMTRGGHANSGPPPDPNALRNDRSDVLGWKVLDVNGRTGDPPAWPLTPATDRETLHWRRLWCTPQAIMWEQLGQVVQVAVYVRRLCDVEAPGATASLGNHVIRLEEDLGLTIGGLRRNRWQLGGGMVPVEQSTGTDGRTAPRAAGGSVRGRLTVVPDGD